MEEIPALQGCLYCHTEGSVALLEARKILGFGSDYPLVRCRHCRSVAWLDVDPADHEHWRIRFRRVNSAAEYYYVALYLGQAGWLSAADALAISLRGYVQRQRVRQVHSGDLSWLPRVEPAPVLPMLQPEETVYLGLHGVTLQEAPSPMLLVRSDQGAVLDSGKLYVTNHRLHLRGQRREWVLHLHDVQRIAYDQRGWTVSFMVEGQPCQYRGVNSADQFDAQLVAAVIEYLRGQNQVA